MKKNVIKTAIAAVCVVAAGFGGVKAYNAANQSESDMLLAENIEALSAGDGGGSSSCSASANCLTPSGTITGSVSCSGSSGSCFSGEGYVQCDGKQSRCTYAVRPEERDSTACAQHGYPLTDE